MAVYASKILQIAKAEIGTKEKPANSNKVKYNTAYYGKAVSGSAYPWCCAFVWWVFNQAGASDLFYSGKKTALCATLMSWFKSQGRFYSVSTKPKAGDIVFYNFSGGSTAKHVGIVESVEGSTIIAIEGNTSTSNQSNGGEVMERKRQKQYILGYGRPAYSENATSDTTTYKTTGNLYLRKTANGTALVIIPKGTVVSRLDSTSKTSGGIIWYHISVTVNGKKYSGYSSAKYLTKV